MAPPIPTQPVSWQELMNGAVPYIAAAVALWIVNLALTSWLAGRRDRSEGVWAVLALLFGPLALLAILALPAGNPLPPEPHW